MYLYSAKNKVCIVIVMVLAFIGQVAATSFISCQSTHTLTNNTASNDTLDNTSFMDHAAMGHMTKKVSENVSEFTAADQNHDMAAMDCCADKEADCSMDSCVIVAIFTNTAQERLFLPTSKIVLPTLLLPSTNPNSLYYPPRV